ncbi:unnamed protein product [Paramecium octaurelia]|uniref:Uncharacterized protein n=1 Tax=Paramecium octaurelia TaxID=43137 RepID=A0A8S1XAL7_PAROT|nr:unnamed protein product [Paramecium octaurelia]
MIIILIKFLQQIAMKRFKSHAQAQTNQQGNIQELNKSLDPSKQQQKQFTKLDYQYERKDSLSFLKTKNFKLVISVFQIKIINLIKLKIALFLIKIQQDECKEEQSRYDNRLNNRRGEIKKLQIKLNNLVSQLQSLQRNEFHVQNQLNLQFDAVEHWCRIILKEFLICDRINNIQKFQGENSVQGKKLFQQIQSS